MGLRMHEWHVPVMLIYSVTQALISIQHVLLSSIAHAGLTSEDEDRPWVLEAQLGDCTWQIKTAVLVVPAHRNTLHTGLTTEDEDKPWVLEAQQGDRISGKISRAQVASVAVAAMGTEASIGEHCCC